MHVGQLRRCRAAPPPAELCSSAALSYPQPIYSPSRSNTFTGARRAEVGAPGTQGLLRKAGYAGRCFGGS